ncbi:MAG: ATP-binding protein [Eubacterium sp.]|nr:ATP-binding protein [Eubacterium sp.]
MDFYGRTKEIAELSHFFDMDSFSVALIYGRRRVGKSELIKHVLMQSKLKKVYYECKQTSDADNAASFSEIWSEFLDVPGIRFDRMEAALDAVFKFAIDTPLILAIDEYSYLRSVSSGIDSVLQRLIDRYKDSSKLKLILCGSVVDIMKGLLYKDNPLYGRINTTIYLEPMDYYDSSMFYPGFSNEDKVRIFSVFGGIPYYNSLIDDKLSVRENLINLLVRQGAQLENEVEYYLSSEISKFNNANEVFLALAKGFSRFGDILSQSHVTSSPALADVLKKLVKIGVVKKVAPINDENNKKKTGYYVDDPLTAFYYRYIYPYPSQRSIMSPDDFYERYIDEDYETQFVPSAFEEICKQFLICINKIGKTAIPFFKIGKYYYDDPVRKINGEFDVVTQDDNGFIFYEAKFKSSPIDDKVVNEEIEQLKLSGVDCYKYGFFSRSGFRVEPRDDLILIDLDEIYGTLS